MSKVSIELDMMETITLLAILRQIEGDQTTFRKFTDSVCDRLESLLPLDFDDLTDICEEIPIRPISLPKINSKESKIKQIYLRKIIAEYTDKLEKAFEKTECIEDLTEELDNII